MPIINCFVVVYFFLSIYSAPNVFLDSYDHDWKTKQLTINQMIFVCISRFSFHNWLGNNICSVSLIETLQEKLQRAYNNQIRYVLYN